MQSNSLSWNSDNDIKLIISALKDGQVVLGSSDTVVGLLVDTTQKGYDALTTIKHRVEKPYIVLIGSHEKAAYFAQKPTSPAVQRLIEHCWPGPLTLILNKKNELPSYIGGTTSVALRMPKHDGLLKLLGYFKGLFSTSANISGQPTPSLVDQVDKQILNKVAYIVDATQSPLSQPSTILDCTQSQIQLIRAGAYDISYLENIASSSFKK